MPLRASKQYVFFFGFGARNTEGDDSMKVLLGMRGAKLAEMARAGLPVPAGFTISTESCAYFNKHEGQFPASAQDQIRAQLKKLEEKTGRAFGDARNPLLLAVRAGAAMPLPGLLESVLNLGMNDKAVAGFAEKTGSERAAWDCYGRCIAGLAAAQLGAERGAGRSAFVTERKRLMEKCGASCETDLSAGQLKDLCDSFKRMYYEKIRKAFPQDPHEQLRLVLAAACASWHSDPAERVRQANRATGLLGAGITVQAMVFGNLGDDSCAGRVVSRDPVTGASGPSGGYLIDAQGEDLTAGSRPEKNISELVREASEPLRRAGEQLPDLLSRLEKLCRHPQDVRFAVERGKLWILQSCAARRAPLAGLRWAVEMATGRDALSGKALPKVLKPGEALMTLSPADLERLLHPVFDPEEERKAVALTTGYPAGPGVATGRLVFGAADAEEAIGKNKDEKLIWAGRETGPADLDGLRWAQGFLTSAGGAGSHAAITARNWGVACVTGATACLINSKNRTLSVGGQVLNAGDWVSLNGFTGTVVRGALTTRPAPILSALIGGGKKARREPVYKLFFQVSKWCDEFRRVKVRANVEAARDATIARALGADGVGLYRTEPMFFSGERIWTLLEFVLADDRAARAKALSRLLALHRSDFEAVLEEMKGRPVAVRLLDPPLQAFMALLRLPLEGAAKRLGLSTDTVEARLKTWLEMSPVLGRRGCRLGIHYPEICVLQTRALTEAACNLEKKGVKTQPEIMVPFVGSASEFAACEAIIREEFARIARERKTRVRISVGAMVEVPRAALTAGEIAESADFFSFGTNDLTQTTFGADREDGGWGSVPSGASRACPADPFQTVDVTGVGRLMELAVKEGREARPGLPCGVCGEHGGDAGSIRFFHKMGLDYVSCAPCRIPIARLAAAQAALKTRAEVT